MANSTPDASWTSQVPSYATVPEALVTAPATPITHDFTPARTPPCDAG